MAGDETPAQEEIEEEAATIDPRDDDAPEQIRELQEEARDAGLADDAGSSGSRSDVRPGS